MKTYTLQISGPLAVFTQRELKVERYTYDVPTPSAIRGVLESIFWHHGVVWEVLTIKVMNPINHISFMRNELKSLPNEKTSLVVSNSTRTQRTTTALRDVRYLVRARLTRSSVYECTKTQLSDYIAKCDDRLANGKMYQTPYLGCREFSADVQIAEDFDEASALTGRRDLGIMFYDYLYPKQDGPVPNKNQKPRALMYAPVMNNGVIEVPSFDSIIAMNGGAF
jgi:CRISPR-associated protein Cas5d